VKGLCLFEKTEKFNRIVLLLIIIGTKLSNSVLFRQIFGIDKISKPYAVIRQKKFDPVTIHITVHDGKDHRVSVPRAYFMGGSFINAQVYVLPVHFPDTFDPYLPAEPVGSAVIQELRRFFGFKRQVNVHRMSLAGTDTCPVAIERVPPFIVGCYNLFKVGHREVHLMPGTLPDKDLHIRPTVFVEHDAYFLRFVPQHQAQKFADGFLGLFVHEFILLREMYWSLRLSAFARN
jgi:hypothetical protein